MMTSRSNVPCRGDPVFDAVLAAVLDPSLTTV
jgi:hypothetical protein